MRLNHVVENGLGPVSIVLRAVGRTTHSMSAVLDAASQHLLDTLRRRGPQFCMDCTDVYRSLLRRQTLVGAPLAVIQDLSCSVIYDMHPQCEGHLNRLQLKALICHLVDHCTARSVQSVDAHLEHVLKLLDHSAVITPVICSCIKCSGPLDVRPSGAHPIVYDVFKAGVQGTEYIKQCSAFQRVPQQQISAFWPWQQRKHSDCLPISAAAHSVHDDIPQDCCWDPLVATASLQHSVSPCRCSDHCQRSQQYGA